MKTSVTKKQSQKTGKEYVALIGERGGKEYVLSFDKYLCMSLADLSPRQLEALKVGDSIEV